MKKLLINSMIWLLLFTHVFYLGFLSIGGSIFLMSSGDVNWWQAILIHVPILPIMASHGKLLDFYGKTIFRIEP